MSSQLNAVVFKGSLSKCAEAYGKLIHKDLLLFLGMWLVMCWWGIYTNQVLRAQNMYTVPPHCGYCPHLGGLRGPTRCEIWTSTQLWSPSVRWQSLGTVVLCIMWAQSGWGVFSLPPPTCYFPNVSDGGRYIGYSPQCNLSLYVYTAVVQSASHEEKGIDETQEVIN